MQSTISRRSLVAGAAASVAACSALSVARADEATPATFADTISWGYETDVLVIGCGGAGAAAAITAAELGLKALVVEKAPEGLDGGNTKFCSQRFLTIDPENKEKMFDYMSEVRGLFTEDMSDESIEYLVDGYTKTAAWFEKLGGFVDDPRVDPEYPELVNSDIVIKNWTAADYQGSFWPTMSRNLNALRESGAIEIWYMTPAVKLIQDPISRAIIGATVERDGELVNVLAHNGVLLACGGFENNNQMVQNYIDMPKCVPLGTQYNTGDGIKMAQAVGADLWHMSATSGPFFEFQDPDTKVCYRQLTGTVSYAGLKDVAAIMIGADGTRFVSETVKLKHGHVMFHGLYIRVPSSFPSYVVFDEAARLTKPFYRVWSQGMEDEIEKGWIVSGQTIEELAEKIDVPAENLAQQIADYNGYCETGVDPLGRQADYLHAFGDGPFYAFPVVPCFINTQGGPVRNTSCQVLDTNREPIPGLYSAGELGSFYSSLYQGAGNVAECIMTGITAVNNMAATPIEAAPLVFTCAEPAYVESVAYEAPVYDCAENQYIGTGDGMSPLYVRVTMDGSTISEVEVMPNYETPRIGSLAIDQIPAAIVEAQSTDIDVVAGATRTSCAIMAGVRDALEQAE